MLAGLLVPLTMIKCCFCFISQTPFAVSFRLNSPLYTLFFSFLLYKSLCPVEFLPNASNVYCFNCLVEFVFNFLLFCVLCFLQHVALISCWISISLKSPKKQTRVRHQKPPTTQRQETINPKPRNHRSKRQKATVTKAKTRTHQTYMTKQNNDTKSNRSPVYLQISSN